MNGTKEFFTGKSDDYALFRPSYPVAAADWLFERCSDVSVVDIGAGTGIFTEVLCKRFSSVSAVEPNADMRQKFSKFLPDVFCSEGSGENTNFPDNSVGLITVAQAFHWLNEDEFKKEAVRILKPNGKVAIVWNTEIADDFMLARNQVCQKYCPRFRNGHAGKRTAAEGDYFLRNIYFREIEYVSFSNPFTMDISIFEGNMRSRSYALKPEDSQFDQFMEELKEVFYRYSVNGTAVEPQETQIYLGSF